MRHCARVYAGRALCHAGNRQLGQPADFPGDTGHGRSRHGGERRWGTGLPSCRRQTGVSPRSPRRLVVVVRIERAPRRPCDGAARRERPWKRCRGAEGRLSLVATLRRAGHRVVAEGITVPSPASGGKRSWLRPTGRPARYAPAADDRISRIAIVMASVSGRSPIGKAFVRHRDAQTPALVSKTVTGFGSARIVKQSSNEIRLCWRTRRRLTVGTVDDACRAHGASPTEADVPRGACRLPSDGDVGALGGDLERLGRAEHSPTGVCQPDRERDRARPREPHGAGGDEDRLGLEDGFVRRAPAGR